MRINGREKVRIKNEKPKAFIDYSQKIMMFMKIWKIIIQRRKESVKVFDDMIVDMESNKKSYRY